MATILITGASGLLGRRLMRAFPNHKVIGTSFSRRREGLRQVDLRDGAAATDLMRSIRPDVIVHAAAERSPDISDRDPEGVRRLNVGVTEDLARLARHERAWILYVSTDYVFDGTRPPYQPGDQPNPLNFYGRTKLEGEQALRNVMPDAGILRIGVLYGPVESLEESAVTALLKPVRMQIPVAVEDWGRRYPTYTEDLAVVIRQIVERRLSDRAFAGTWHWCGNECFTKFGQAKAIGEEMEISTDHIAPDPNPPSGAPRPRDCRLDCSALESLGMGRRTRFRTAIRDVLKPFV